MDIALATFKAIENVDIEVHFPGRHQGECNSAYVVVKEMNQMPNGSPKNVTKVIHLILYVPEISYSSISSFRQSVKAAVEDLPISLTGNETPVIPETETKSFTTSIEYACYQAH